MGKEEKSLAKHQNITGSAKSPSNTTSCSPYFFLMRLKRQKIVQRVRLVQEVNLA